MRSVSDIGATAPILHSPTQSVLARIKDVEPLDSAQNPAQAGAAERHGVKRFNACARARHHHNDLRESPTLSEEVARPAPERTPVTDEVLRRVGRNLVIFQQVEHALKFMTTHARFHAPASQFAERFAKHAESIAKKSMGDLAGKLTGTVLAQDERDGTPDVIEEAWFGFRFTIETDAESVARHEAELKELVDRRNELVHHFLPRWQAAVGGDADTALAWLDEQRGAAIGMLDRLQGWARIVETARKEHAAFLASEEGARQMELLFLRSSRLVVMLGQIAMATPRADGWTVLQTAGNLIRRDAPSELLDLRARFGHATLKAVLLATELFDVEEEATPGGGTRTIFRINERWRLESPPVDATAGKSESR